MAASTITRDTWTNDSGTPSAPVGDGTLINNAALQNNIYARIDAMFAGAGAYATLEFGGKIQVDGFGQQVFSAGGTGTQSLLVRNTTAGTTNSAAIFVANDADATLAYFQAFSSTYTTAGPSVANGAAVICEGAGGLSVAATNAAGVIRFYTGGVTQRLSIGADGTLTGNFGANMTHSLTVSGGFHSFQVGAPVAGAGAKGQFLAQSDSCSCSIAAFSSTFSTASYTIANGTLLSGTGSAGLQYAAPSHTWWDSGGPTKLAIITNGLVADNGLFLVNNLHVGSLTRLGRTVNPTNAVNIYPGTAPSGAAGGNQITLFTKSNGTNYRLYYMDEAGNQYGPL